MLDRTFRRFLVAALSFPLASLLLTHASPASAQEAVRSESYWYGWQTMSADGASLAVVALGASTGASVVTWAGIGGLVLGAPLVHVANKRGEIGAVSLGLRIALPLLGAGIGYASAGSCYEDPNSHEFLGHCFLHGLNEAAAGLLVGLASASIIDASALSYGRRETAKPQETAKLRVTAVAPSYDPLTRTASLGMGGSF